MPPPVSTVAKPSSKKPALDVCQEADVHPSLDPPPYESHLVCEFFRQIGRLETAQDYELNLRAKARGLLAAAKSSDSKDSQRKALNDLQALVAEAEKPLSGYRATLVGNAQNPLDHLVGDVIGQTDSSRYFIIEFKRYAHGFVEEVSLMNGKPDRMALFDHLLSDSRCKELSEQGHLGAYFDYGKIVFGAYFDLATGIAAEIIQLSAFFDKMQEPNFAWSRDDLLAYITCMTIHGVDMASDDGQIVFGYIDQSGQFVAMTSTAKIFTMIHEAFKRAHAMQNSQKVFQSHTQQSTAGPRPRGG